MKKIPVSKLAFDKYTPGQHLPPPAEGNIALFNQAVVAGVWNNNLVTVNYTPPCNCNLWVALDIWMAHSVANTDLIARVYETLVYGTEVLFARDVCPTANEWVGLTGVRLLRGLTKDTAYAFRLDINFGANGNGQAFNDARCTHLNIVPYAHPGIP